MSWDEKLFGWFWRGARGVGRKAVSPEMLARRAHLADLSDRLRVLATAIAGAEVRLLEAESVGGAAPGVLWLPPFMDIAPTAEANERAYVLRVALGATAMREGFLPRRPLALPERAVFTMFSTRETIAALVEELPAAAEELERWSELAPETGETPFGLLVRTFGSAETSLSVSEKTARALELAPTYCPKGRVIAHPLFGLFDGNGLESAVVSDAGAHSLPKGTELRMRKVDRATQKELGDEREENPLVHSFEKLHTLEEHKGGRKRADGSDELEAHAEALEELEITEVIRSNEHAESLLRSDAMFESTAGDVADVGASEGIPYDEWDARGRVFRPDWCRVKVQRIAAQMLAGAAEEAAKNAIAGLLRPIDATRNAFLVLEQAARPRLRELDGPDIDDDAMVSRFAALCAKSTPPDRLHAARRRHRPELAVLLLIDASLSTDGWIEGRRVLDVERETALVMGEALEGLVDTVAIAAFSSQTRRDCRFDVIKGLNEPWARARHRLFDVVPAGYTRIGPALRHGRAVLERATAQRKLILLLTDGKPNDYDRYEGSYGLDDVQHAVLEASAAGIHVHGLAIDLSARANLPRMFGLGRFTLLRSPSALPLAVGEVIARMGR